MARPQGSAYDIGAWEYAAAAASTGYARGRVVNRGGIGSAYVRGNLVN